MALSRHCTVIGKDMNRRRKKWVQWRRQGHFLEVPGRINVVRTKPRYGIIRSALQKRGTSGQFSHFGILSAMACCRNVLDKKPKLSFNLSFRAETSSSRVYIFTWSLVLMHTPKMLLYILVLSSRYRLYCAFSTAIICRFIGSVYPNVTESNCEMYANISFVNENGVTVYWSAHFNS